MHEYANPAYIPHHHYENTKTFENVLNQRYGLEDVQAVRKSSKNSHESSGSPATRSNHNNQVGNNLVPIAPNPNPYPIMASNGHADAIKEKVKHEMRERKNKHIRDLDNAKLK